MHYSKKILSLLITIILLNTSITPMNKGNKTSQDTPTQTGTTDQNDPTLGAGASPQEKMEALQAERTREVRDRIPTFSFRNVKREFLDKKEESAADRTLPRMKALRKSWMGGKPQLMKVGYWGGLKSRTEEMQEQKTSIENLLGKLTMKENPEQEINKGKVIEKGFYQLDQETQKELVNRIASLRELAAELQEGKGFIMKTKDEEGAASLLELAKRLEDIVRSSKVVVHDKKDGKKLKEELKEAKKKEEEETEKINKKLKEKNLEKELDDAIKATEKLAKKLEKEDAKVLKAQEKVEAIKKKIKNTTNENAKAQLQTQLETAEQNLTNAQSARNTVISEQTKKQSETEELLKEIDEIKKPLTKQQLKVDELEDRIKFSENQKKLADTLKNYKRLASGEKWSSKKKILSFLGTIIAGGIGAILYVATGLDTDVDIEGEDSFVPESYVEEAERFGDVENLDQQFSETGGYLQMGDFSGASIGEGTGQVDPIKERTQMGPTTEELNERKIIELSTSKAFGRELTSKEQEKLFKLLMDIDHNVSSLKELTENLENLTPAEKNRILDYRQEIKKLTFEFYFTELSVRYSHDDGSLTLLEDYDKTIALLDQITTRLSNKIPSLMQKKEALKKALDSPQDLPKETTERIQIGIQKLNDSIALINAKISNIANEKQFLTLTKAIYEGGITEQEQKDQLLVDINFARDAVEPYEKSQGRRLKSDMEGTDKELIDKETDI